MQPNIILAIFLTYYLLLETVYAWSKQNFSMKRTENFQISAWENSKYFSTQKRISVIKGKQQAHCKMQRPLLLQEHKGYSNDYIAGDGTPPSTLLCMFPSEQRTIVRNPEYEE